MNPNVIYKMFRHMFDSIGLKTRRDVAQAMGVTEKHTWRTLRGDVKEIACIIHVFKVIIENDPDRRIECDLELLERVLVTHYRFDETARKEINKVLFPHFSKNEELKRHKDALRVIERYLQEFLNRAKGDEKREAQYNVDWALKVLKQSRKIYPEDTQNDE